MTELPVKKICTQCGESFYTMPSRVSKIPGAGHLCRRCRIAVLDAADGPKRADHPPCDSVPPHAGNAPARGSRLYPCRICGAYSVNRFYCPDHHQQISMENGPYAEDFGFGAGEGVASRAGFMEHVDSSLPSEG
ncbi:MAG: hypothetical protein ACOCWR_03210 [Oceanidesulfovibrio sp.]